MEGSESETTFESLNLNPQLFLNEVLNSVDDLLLQTFDYFYQEASTKLNAEATQRSQHLKQGVDCIRDKIQSVLDQKLSVWEKFCIRHCFSLPQGFQMPNTLTEESSGNDIDSSAPSDSDLDAQLDSLRKKLSEVGKESEMLNQEFQALERQSSDSSLNARYINEAVQPYEQSNYHELFQEIVATTSELRMKMRKLNTDMIEETKQIKTKEIDSAEVDLCAINPAKRFSNVTLEEIQEFATLLKIESTLSQEELPAFDIKNLYKASELVALLARADSFPLTAGSNSQTPNRDFSSLTAERLRSLLRAKGLSAKGKKKELIARLKDADG